MDRAAHAHGPPSGQDIGLIGLPHSGPSHAHPNISDRPQSWFHECLLKNPMSYRLEFIDMYTYLNPPAMLSGQANPPWIKSIVVIDFLQVSCYRLPAPFLPISPRITCKGRLLPMSGGLPVSVFNNGGFSVCCIMYSALDCLHFGSFSSLSCTQTAGHGNKHAHSNSGAMYPISFGFFSL